MSSPRHNEERSGSQGYLPRGGACVSCRRRKMVCVRLRFEYPNITYLSVSQKCDGKRPICTQCDRAGRAEDCEYTVGQERSTVQILEENISRLEARIQELQNPVASTSNSIELHQPYGVSPSAHSNTGSGNLHFLSQDLPAHLAEGL